MKISKGSVLRFMAAGVAALLLIGPAAALAEGDKTAVTITGVSVESKTYDGAPVSPSGEPVIKDASENTVTIASDGLVYAYASTDGGTYLDTTPPTNAGAYTLTISVSGGNATYEGSSDPIPFTISKATLSVNPDGGKTRYAGLNDPAFTFSCTGQIPGETPAFSGSLSGEATISSAEGVYDIAIGSLALSDSGAFLADNYTLSLAPDAAYRVVNYPSDAVATLASTNLGANGTYTGDVTLNAPDGYEIAFSSAGEWAASVTKTDCVTDDNAIYYYLRVSGGNYDGAITERKMLSAKYDAANPVVSLYSPTTDAAVSGNQKIILSLDEYAAAGSGASISVSADDTTYTAEVANASALGDASGGPWYFVFDLNDFSPVLSLTAGTEYTVTVPAGIFTDAAGNGNAKLIAVFTTSASGGHAVVFTQANGLLSVRTGTDDAVVSGQAVADGTQLIFDAPAEGGYSLNQTILEDGTENGSAELSAYTLSGDLEVYYTRVLLDFSGTATISGTVKAGETLTGGVDGANQSDSSGWTFTWVRRDGGVDTPLASGGSGTSYTLTAADIGKTIRLAVTDSVCVNGVLYKETVTVAKADYAGSAVSAPVIETLGETEIALTATDGYEYSAGGTTWQDSPSFTGLTSGQSYDFYQRVKATDTVNASPKSEKTTAATISALTGTVSISGTAQSGQLLTGSIEGSNNTGTLTYAWKRGTTTVGTGTTYTPGAADIGQTLTLEVTSSVQTGTRSAASAAVLKAVCSQSVPAAPTLASASATSITLTATQGYQYSLGGTAWQDTTTFHNLSIDTSYMFYQRVKETDTELGSASSPGAPLTTLPALSGVIMISGEARYGMTIVASLTSTNNTGTLTYTWKRGTLTVGTGTTYVVGALDIDNQLSLEVTSSDQGGSITRSFGTVQKAYYFGDTPSAPTRYSRTTSKIVLKSVDGCEYSRNGTTWQDSTTFSGLSAGTTYTFYQRYKETTTMEASPTSALLKTATLSSSSSDDDSSTSATPTPTPSSSSATALYSYTLNSDDTRILYSVMKNLAEGNKTQDVTIKQSNVEITFLKGTMTDSYTKLWYDFGTSINNSIAEQTAKRIAGDAYVATIHFNYDGTLPGTASIRFWLGAANAGKTLYYYKLEDDDTLTFMQTAVTDSTGWATVTQTSCSDYVFLDQDVESASANPTPSPDASAGVSPTPTPLIAANDTSSSGLSAEGWFIAALVLLAIALIVGGIWLYTKNRDEY